MYMTMKMKEMETIGTWKGNYIERCVYTYVCVLECAKLFFSIHSAFIGREEYLFCLKSYLLRSSNHSIFAQGLVSLGLTQAFLSQMGFFLFLSFSFSLYIPDSSFTFSI